MSDEEYKLVIDSKGPTHEEFIQTIADTVNAERLEMLSLIEEDKERMLRLIVPIFDDITIGADQSSGIIFFKTSGKSK